MKGITPIISVIILLLITIGLASAAWTYMSGYMSNLTSRVFETSAPSCIQGTTVTFLVRNAGTGTMSTVNLVGMDLNTGLSVTISWTNVSNQAQTITQIGPGETARATIGSPACTTVGMPKTCNYEITIVGTTQKATIPVSCTG